MTPNQVNRAHWPTKENTHNFDIFCIFPAHAKNGPRWPQMGPGGFFPTNPDLADILGNTDFDFEICVFIFLGLKFLAWAHFGPGLGPGLGQSKTKSRLCQSLCWWAIGSIGSNDGITRSGSFPPLGPCDCCTQAYSPPHCSLLPPHTAANKQHFDIFLHVSGPRKKWAQMAPNGARRIFSY